MRARFKSIAALKRLPACALAFLVCLLFVCAAPTRADETAPFGLSWGVSVKKLEASGVRLSPRPQDESGLRFAASNLPNKKSKKGGIMDWLGDLLDE